jgi:hypothetical protein
VWRRFNNNICGRNTPSCGRREPENDGHAESGRQATPDFFRPETTKRVLVGAAATGHPGCNGKPVGSLWAAFPAAKQLDPWPDALAEFQTQDKLDNIKSAS